jgi:hypothetical protein
VRESISRRDEPLEERPCLFSPTWEGDAERLFEAVLIERLLADDIDLVLNESGIDCTREALRLFGATIFPALRHLVPNYALATRLDSVEMIGAVSGRQFIIDQATQPILQCFDGPFAMLSKLTGWHGMQ